MTAQGLVLLIEDEESIAEMMRTMLERDGFRLVHALDGRTGLERLRERSPRLVLLDLNLPDMDGVEVCRRIRAASDVPVIMLTARDGEIDKVVGLELEADEFTLHPEPVDVAAHLAELAVGFRPRALAARVRLEIDTAPAGTVVADPDRLAQIAANLLENALRYTPEAGHVRLGTRRDGDIVVIEVADSGSGIDPADLPHVFDRFYVARRYRRIRPEGSGLGLAIVKRLVEAMEADVTVASTDSGTTFAVRFPGT